MGALRFWRSTRSGTEPHLGHTVEPALPAPPDQEEARTGTGPRQSTSVRPSVYKLPSPKPLCPESGVPKARGGMENCTTRVVSLFSCSLCCFRPSFIVCGCLAPPPSYRYLRSSPRVDQHEVWRQPRQRAKKRISPVSAFPFATIHFFFPFFLFFFFFLFSPFFAFSLSAFLSFILTFLAFHSFYLSLFPPL